MHQSFGRVTDDAYYVTFSHLSSKVLQQSINIKYKSFKDRKAIADRYKFQ